MALFESLEWGSLLISGAITTVVISAIVIIFDEFFVARSRKKILTLAVALIVTLVTVEFDLVQWQATISGWLLTFGSSVVIYHYLGVEWLQKFLVSKFGAK